MKTNVPPQLHVSNPLVEQYAARANCVNGARLLKSEALKGVTARFCTIGAGTAYADPAAKVRKTAKSGGRCIERGDLFLRIPSD